MGTAKSIAAHWVHLSTFERWLNRALWGVLFIALIGAALQHVFLANVPEWFPTGARWGDLFYDLAIAYVGSFVFYLLVVRLPLRRDRAKYYRHLAPLVVRLVAEASALMESLNKAAKLDTSRPHSQANIREMLQKLRFDTEAEHVIATQEGNSPGTVADVMAYHLDRTRKIIHEVLNFAPYYDSKVVEVVGAMDDCDLFLGFDTIEPQIRIGRNISTAPLEAAIFDFLQLADRLNNYRKQNLPVETSNFPELIGTTSRESDAVPLKGEIPGPPPRSARLGTKSFDSSRIR